MYWTERIILAVAFVLAVITFLDMMLLHQNIPAAFLQ